MNSAIYWPPEVIGKIKAELSLQPSIDFVKNVASQISSTAPASCAVRPMEMVLVDPGSKTGYVRCYAHVRYERASGGLLVLDVSIDILPG